MAPIPSTIHLPWKTRLQARIVALDLVLIAVSLAVAVYVRFGESPKSRLIGFAQLSYVETALLLGAGWLIALAAGSSYHLDVVGVGSEEYRKVTRATLLLFGAIAITATTFKIHFARGFLAIALPLGLALLLLGRLIHRRVLLRERIAGNYMAPALVVGSPVEVRYVVDLMRRQPFVGYAPVAVATASEEDFELTDGSTLPEMGSLEDTAEAAARIGASIVVVAGQSQIDPKSLRRLSWQLEERGCELALATRMTDVAGPRIHWRPIEDLPLIRVEMPRYTGGKFVAKRAFDLVAALGMLVLFAPVMVVTAILVKAHDGGPIFFRQSRVGMNQVEFKMTKFRSMVIDAENKLEELRASSNGNGNGNEVLFKMHDDPRVTRVGRFIRRYSIDELPQLFDVIRGSMSLVGPRPPLPAEVLTYDHRAERRLYVKPGMTGPWQVGGRSGLTWEESIRKDLYYVENWSMTGDLLILAQTVQAVIKGDGAY